MKNILKNTLLVMVLLCLCEVNSNALSVQTHEKINTDIAETKKPLNGFILDTYLKEKMSFENGFSQEFNAKSVSEWLKDGGLYEDLPLATWNPITWLPYQRSFNHFHDPLVPLDKAGYSFFGLSLLQVGESAILWSQREPEKQRIGYYSWHDARKYFYNALTMTDKATRDTNFAEMFRGVGQVMHLVSDMSVPEHSRNDGYSVVLGRQIV